MLGLTLYVNNFSYASDMSTSAVFCKHGLYDTNFNFRVCSPPDPFLLVLYNPSHSRPEFYECSTATGSNKMTFDFYSGYEAVQISKVTTFCFYFL
jgi:hypothetical protein